jgi:hypothetical protein
MAGKNKTEAVAYLRTSSASNVGADKDSEHRQLEAIERFAKHAGFKIIETFRDPAVSGADPIEGRPGFLLASQPVRSLPDQPLAGAGTLRRSRSAVDPKIY